MGYSQIWEWIYENFDTQNYFSAEDLLYDVKNAFNKTRSYFPPEAEDLVRERFQYRREYAEMVAKQQEQQQIADFIGSGQVPKSLSDEIVEDYASPRSEIMDIDMTEYATTKESVTPPEIIKFRKQSFFSKIASGFKRLFRR